MCLQASSVSPWDSWNWSGDEIIHAPIIPASRCIPGTSKRYPIDVREFLTTTNNAVVSRALNELIHELPPQEQGLFRSHSRGSFDFRADQVMEFIGRKLKYRPAANLERRCPDAWLFPDETLAQRGGDCEDLALLLAALLLAAGISGYCVRVALGSLQIALPDGKIQEHDHCWVMYQNEGGVWEILEPLNVVTAASSRSAARRQAQPAPCTEYVPHYVFNTDHLWVMFSPTNLPGRELPGYWKARKFWNKFDPSFAASVHESIFDRALAGLASADALSRIKRKSLWLDVNILTYDPRDHFDNGYIDEGWAAVNSHLAQFKRDNSDWESFGAAGHGIGDFYAHSSYLHFAKLQNAASPDGAALIYEPGVAMAGQPGYSSTPPGPGLAPFDITSGKFSINGECWHGTQQEAVNHWSGKFISGRYAQKYDPKATFWEGFTSLPRALAGAPGFSFRGSLPHHNEIAVDEKSISGRHLLYRKDAAGADDRQGFANQFRWRMNTAILHIRKAFQDNWQGSAP